MAVSVYAGFYNALDNGVVGNGTTDDAPAIQALITAVTTAGGGTLYFPPNHTYLLGSTIYLASNQTYLGGGDTSVWLLKAGVPSATLIANTPVTYLNATTPVPTSYGISNVRLERLTLDSNSANIDLNPLTAKPNGVGFQQVTNVLIRDCRFRNANAALWFVQSVPSQTNPVNPSPLATSDVRILDNHFDNWVQAGIWVEDQNNNGLLVGSQFIVRGNTFVPAPGQQLDNGEGAITFDGSFGIFDGNMILGNVVHNSVNYNNPATGSPDTGIFVKGFGLDNVVTNNLISTSHAGMFVGHRVNVIGNNITSTSDNAITIDYQNTSGTETNPWAEAVVIGNNCHDLGASGIALTDCTQVVVVGNMVSRAGTMSGVPSNESAGISTYIVGTGQTTPGYLTITGNAVHDNTVPPVMLYGILLQGVSTDMHVLGNTVTGAVDFDYAITPGTNPPYSFQTGGVFYLSGPITTSTYNSSARSVTANTTALTTDHTIVVSGTVTLTLFSAGSSPGQELAVVNNGTGTVTIQTASGDVFIGPLSHLGSSITVAPNQIVRLQSIFATGSPHAFLAY